MTRDEIFVELLALPNPDLEVECKGVFTKVIEYQKSNDEEEDFQLYDLSDLAGIWMKEALCDMNNINALEKSRKSAERIFERLDDLEEWEYYDVRIAARAISLARTNEHAIAFSERTLKELEKFSDHEMYWRVKAELHIEMLGCLMRIKYDKTVQTIKSDDLKEVFSSHAQDALAICAANIETYSTELLQISIRSSMFFANSLEEAKKIFIKTFRVHAMRAEYRECEMLFNHFYDTEDEGHFRRMAQFTVWR